MPTLHAAEILCKAFALGPLVRHENTGGTRNQALILHTATGAWLARRRHPSLCGEDRLRFDHDAIQHLARCGAAVLSPRPSQQRLTWHTVENETWEVYAFLEARPMRQDHAEDATALGTALGRFHQAGLDFATRLDKLGPRGETDPAGILERIQNLSNISPECAQATYPYRTWTEKAAKALPDARYLDLPHTLVHGDVQPANILFAQSEVAAFVDLDWCAWRPRIYDLAFALPFCCATREHPIDGSDIWSLTQSFEMRPALCYAFLDAYQQETAPLTPEEHTALPAQLILSWCHARIFGAFKVPESQRARFLARPPQSVDNLETSLPARLD